jgi:hypothetical protein
MLSQMLIIVKSALSEGGIQTDTAFPYTNLYKYQRDYKQRSAYDYGI